MAKQKAPVKKTPAKKQPAKKGASKSRKKKTAAGSGILLRVSLAMILVLAAAAGVAYMATHYAPPPPPPPASPPAAANVQPKAPPPPPRKAPPPVKRPVYEVFEDKMAEIHEEEPEPPPAPPKAVHDKPCVAIIIDDMGYGNGAADKLLALPHPLTFSILPHSPRQKEIAQKVHDKGLDVLLHLPMEPMEYPRVDPGPGTLLTSMSTDALVDVLNENLDAVPYIKGVNNHMGSRLTTESGALYPIFTVLKKRGLFFVDSRTSRHTVCKPSARLFQLPFAQRDVFLDHVRTNEFVDKQLTQLVARAKRRGQAIGIGHPYNATYSVLAARLPEISREVDLVPVSELVATAP